MCSGRHHLIIITMVFVNKNWERRRIHINSVQHSQTAIILTLPTDLFHEIKTQNSAYF
jgi:hypothetical protein